MDGRGRSCITATDRDDGRVVTLAHGWGGDEIVWQRVTATLGGQSRLSLFDHVRAGRSDRMAWDTDRDATSATGHCPQVRAPYVTAQTISASVAERR